MPAGTLRSLTPPFRGTRTCFRSAPTWLGGWTRQPIWRERCRLRSLIWLIGPIPGSSSESLSAHDAESTPAAPIVGNGGPVAAAVNAGGRDPGLERADARLHPR